MSPRNKHVIGNCVLLGGRGSNGGTIRTADTWSVLSASNSRSRAPRRSATILSCLAFVAQGHERTSQSRDHQATLQAFQAEWIKERLSEVPGRSYRAKSTWRMKE